MFEVSFSIMIVLNGKKMTNNSEISGEWSIMIGQFLSTWLHQRKKQLSNIARLFNTIGSCTIWMYKPIIIKIVKKLFFLTNAATNCTNN